MLQAAYKLDAAAALAGIGLNRILNAPWRPASAAEPRLQVALPKFKISQDMLPVGQVCMIASLLGVVCDCVTELKLQVLLLGLLVTPGVPRARVYVVVQQSCHSGVSLRRCGLRLIFNPVFVRSSRLISWMCW